MFDEKNLRKMVNVVKAAKRFNHAPVIALNHFRPKRVRNAESLLDTTYLVTTYAVVVE